MSATGTAKVLSVSSLNQMAKSLLEGHFSQVAVEGEISNFANPASGHWYFTLKDQKSQLRCAMFAGRNRLVQFNPKNGDQLIVRGQLSIYPNRGDYQLIVSQMEEAGDGALRRAFEELKQRLRAEGLFDQRHKQEIMEGYHHVGLITSAAGAAICDMVSVFGRRFPATRLTVFPVAVQGAEAPGEISSALALANALTDELGLQALIVGRGGGSLEDLQAFNEESVARAIFASELPVVSAVGHESDFTIADLVADLRAPTPSAAAEVLSPNQLDYLEQLQGLLQRFSNLAGQSLTRRKEQLIWMVRRLRRPDRRLQDHAQTLDRLELQLKRVLRNRLQRATAQLALQQQALVALSPAKKLSQQRTQLTALSQRLAHSGRRHLDQRQKQLVSLSRNLNAVSPLAVLGRGFSISLTDSSQVVRQTADVAPGQTIVTRLADGTIHSSVTETRPNPSDD
ncbi:MAG: exodeoxyribonuclease VII large subunit [Pseudomonadota bacterium]|nr:exodeoxyribonuclease VII large subunit [Pseudomonadota bacterium]MEC7996898.1 exodeoxyribonuclease VII large subunit [Pseudomonadota bacterium]